MLANPTLSGNGWRHRVRFAKTRISCFAKNIQGSNPPSPYVIVGQITRVIGNNVLWKKIGYFHGRFQPFHNGHLSVVKYAIKLCDLLVIGLSNPFRLPPIFDDTFSLEAVNSMKQARLPENNPWPYWARILMIRESLRTEEIDLEKIIFIPNLNNTG